MGEAGLAYSMFTRLSASTIKVISVLRSVFATQPSLALAELPWLNPTSAVR
jgi:hypothetical protein